MKIYNSNVYIAVTMNPLFLIYKANADFGKFSLNNPYAYIRCRCEYISGCAKPEKLLKIETSDDCTSLRRGAPMFSRKKCVCRQP